MRSASLKRLSDALIDRWVAHCDAHSEAEVDARSSSGFSVKAPQGFDNLKNTLNSASVNSFDGFRAIVQKQVNLNTVVSHFFWVGSQATGQPIYQYRVILPLDDGKLINVASDADCNSVEGEVKLPIAADVELSDHSSTTQVEYSVADDQTLTASYMQTINQHLVLGGSGSYSLSSKSLTTAFGGLLQWDDNMLAAQWDQNVRVLFTKKVNPNRVHVSTDLLVDANGDSKMSLTAEYILKQSRLSMSVDSNVALKSLLETTIAPGVQLQLGADMSQLQGQYRFGYGIMMG